nr:MAG TPA: hypothetical protein [Caudoviricetes sp.]
MAALRSDRSITCPIKVLSILRLSTRTLRRGFKKFSTQSRRTESLRCRAKLTNLNFSRQLQVS